MKDELMVDRLRKKLNPFGVEDTDTFVVAGTEEIIKYPKTQKKHETVVQDIFFAELGPDALPPQTGWGSFTQYHFHAAVATGAFVVFALGLVIGRTNKKQTSSTEKRQGPDNFTTDASTTKNKQIVKASAKIRGGGCNSSTIAPTLAVSSRETQMTGCIPTSSDPPELIPEAAQEANVLSLVVRACEQHTLTRRNSKEDAVAVAQEFCEWKDSFRETVAKNGHDFDDKTLSKIAIDRLHEREKEEAEFRRECRGYAWDFHQRNLDRRVNERRHKETIAVAREEKNWQCKLRAARDKRYADLLTAVEWAGTAVVGAPPLVTLVTMLLAGSFGPIELIWNHADSMNQYFVSYCSEAAPQPTTTTFFGSFQGAMSYLPTSFGGGLYASLRGAMSYLPSSLGGSLCSVTQALILIIECILAVVLISPVSMFPRIIKKITFAIASLVMFGYAGGAAIEYLSKWAIIIFALWAFWQGFLYWKYRRFVALLKNLEAIPSVAQLDEAVEWFDAIGKYLYCPLAFVALFAAFNCYKG